MTDKIDEQQDDRDTALLGMNLPEPTDKPVSYVGPMSEDDYLDTVERIQQAMAIEPFRPPMIDVLKLLSDWRMQHEQARQLRDAGLRLAAESAAESFALRAEIEELRRHDKEATDLTIDQQVEIGRLDTENRRLLVDNAELSVECDRWQRKVADCWREIEQLRAQVEKLSG